MPELPVLDAAEQRVLGCLLEKQVTVPGSYPLTLNSLRTACNQTSSRDPLTQYSEAEVQAAARALKERGLVRIVWAVQGSRTLKYYQSVDQQIELDDAERALLTVLLLRGAQSAGELKTRTERLHSFADKADVSVALRSMGERTPPLVTELGLRSGQQDRRWAHLLGPAPMQDAGEPADTEVVLAEGTTQRNARVVASYDAAAQGYADRFGDELAHKPFDRWLLERVAALADGPIADVGCGPGHIAAHLTHAGARAEGFDLAPEMITVARARYPEQTFEVADFTRLLRPRRAGGWGAIVAWYAFVHLAASELPGAIAHLGSTLDSGGWLALAVHSGNKVLHADELCGAAVDLDFVLHEPTQVLAAVAAAGLVDVEWYLRSPGSDEAQTERLYVLCRRG